MTAKLPRPVRLFAELCAARVRWQQQRAEMFDVNNAWYPAFNLPAFNSIGRDSAWKASKSCFTTQGLSPIRRRAKREQPGTPCARSFPRSTQQHEKL